MLLLSEFLGDAYLFLFIIYNRALITLIVY